MQPKIVLKKMYTKIYAIVAGRSYANLHLICISQVVWEPTCHM